MKFFVSCRKSKKTGNCYVGLFVNNGFRDVLLTVDKLTILEVTGKSMNELNQLAIGEVIELN